MAVTTQGPVLTRPGRGGNGADPLFKRLTLALASAVILVVIAMLADMTWESHESLARFGLGFLGGQVWDPVHAVYGALPFIYGTLSTSLIALLLAGTVGLGAALFLTEIAPSWLRTPLSFLIELLAAIPSVVYGVWGIFVLGPFLKDSVIAERVERSLRQAALWDEVKDKLNHAATALSGGQQQRLCLARTIAVEPQIILMDEPASALDPIATLKIEELMLDLKQHYTIVIVTHNMQQAARVSDTTGVFMVRPDRAGELIEVGPTRQIFTNPRDSRTEAYITGRIG